MQKRRKKKERAENKAPRCAVCGKHSILRSASYVYGSNVIDPNKLLYVCSDFPECNSYVGTHPGTKKPLGSLANRELRQKRIEAHRVVNQIVHEGIMTKYGTYEWLAACLSLARRDTHIGNFSLYYCDETIKRCKNLIDQQKKEGRNDGDKMGGF